MPVKLFMLYLLNWQTLFVTHGLWLFSFFYSYFQKIMLSVQTTWCSVEVPDMKKDAGCLEVPETGLKLLQSRSNSFTNQCFSLPPSLRLSLIYSF